MKKWLEDLSKAFYVRNIEEEVCVFHNVKIVSITTNSQE